MNQGVAAAAAAAATSAAGVGAMVGGANVAAVAAAEGAGLGAGALRKSEDVFTMATLGSNKAPSSSKSSGVGREERDEDCGEDMECFADPDDEDGEVKECVDTTVEFAGSVSGTVLMKVSRGNAALEAAEPPFIFGGSAAASVAAAVAAGMDLPESSKEEIKDKVIVEEVVDDRPEESAEEKEVFVEAADVMAVEESEVKEVVEMIEEKVLAPQGAFEYFSDGEDFVDKTIVPQTRSKY